MQLFLKPHEKQLPLQWMQRHHKSNHVFWCVDCHVNIIKDGHPIRSMGWICTQQGRPMTEGWANPNQICNAMEKIDDD
jgi:hypothetical protein